MSVCMCVCLCVAESMTNQHLVGWPTNLPSLHKVSRLIVLRHRTKDPHRLNLFISHIRLLWHIIEHPSISSRKQLHRIAPRRWCTFSTFKSPSDHWFYFEGFLNSSAWSLRFVTAERIVMKKTKSYSEKFFFFLFLIPHRVWLDYVIHHGITIEGRGADCWGVGR